MVPTSPSCGRCQELESKVAALETEMKRVLELLACAKKNSTNSSKPPSSDLVKPKPVAPSGGSKRTIGGQLGHPKHQRLAFPPEQVTAWFTHELQTCPGCGSPLQSQQTTPRVTQQVDVARVPLTIQEHVQPEYWCDCCKKTYRASLPSGIERGGLVGPNLTILIAFMKGYCHASFSTIRTFLREVVGVTVARSTLSNTINKVSQALDGPYEELLRLLPNETVLNVDETGHKCNKELWWTWCLRADLYTLFKIDPHRRASVLIELLGREFQGTIGCDYFSAYRKYMRVCGVEVQFCLAHLIRDVKFLLGLKDEAAKAYGEKLRVGLKDLFEVIHQRENMPAESFDAKLRTARDKILREGQANVPQAKQAVNLARRLQRHGQAFFTFVTTPGVAPTNNLAEQAIRFVVIDRRITQGTRSEAGRRWSERIWSVIATCAGQGRSVYDYLSECVDNWYEELPAPSLLPKQARIS